MRTSLTGFTSDLRNTDGLRKAAIIFRDLHWLDVDIAAMEETRIAGSRALERRSTHSSGMVKARRGLCPGLVPFSMLFPGQLLSQQSKGCGAVGRQTSMQSSESRASSYGGHLFICIFRSKMGLWSNNRRSILTTDTPSSNAIFIVFRDKRMPSMLE